MVSKHEVDHFLREFKEKMKIWDVLFRDDRGKNTQTLAELEIRPSDREKILRELVSTDYSEGPLDEKLYGGSDLWVFGKEIKHQGVYIKISMGFANDHVICISFHIAEYQMSFPFKN